MKSWGYEEMCLYEIFAVWKLWIFAFKISSFSLPGCCVSVIDITFTAAGIWHLKHRSVLFMSN